MCLSNNKSVFTLNLHSLTLLCFRGLRLLLMSKQSDRAPSSDAQQLMLLLDMGNYKQAQLEVSLLQCSFAGSEIIYL